VETGEKTLSLNDPGQGKQKKQAKNKGNKGILVKITLTVGGGVLGGGGAGG